MVRFASFLCLALFCFRAALLAGAVTPAPKGGGTLRFGIDSDIISLNPFQRTLSITKQVGSVAFECLLTVDKNEDLKPALATSWAVSKDGLQYTFKLRKGAKFHDGKDVTAEDVLWSIQYAQDPKNGAYGRDKVNSIQSLKAVDPLTLHVFLKEPYVPFLASLSTGFDAFPVVPKGSVPFGRERMTSYPPGTGPFMMTEHRPNQLIAFKKFDQYWQKGLPYLDAIHFRSIEDTPVRFTALRTGELDIAMKVAHEQALRIQRGELKELRLEFTQTSGYRALIFNTERPPFNNLKLRQAVAYAIDKAKIIEGASFGFGTVHNQKVQKRSRWYVPTKGRESDLGKARTLLREAGYPNGIRLKARISRGWPNSEVMQIIQNQLKEVDILVDIELIDFARNQEEKRSGEFEIAPLGGATYIDPDLAYYQYFRTENAPVKISNFPRYSNPRVDSLLGQGRQEPDFQKRHRIYREIVEILHEEVPQITLGFIPYVYAYGNHVKGFEVQEHNDDFNYAVGGLVVTWLER
jgi:peptide/nickel transport system substrate-binding protein